MHLLCKHTNTVLYAGVIFLLALSEVSTAQTFKVGSYTSPPLSFSTVSYWIEGPQSSVLIDTQFLPKEGLEAMRKAERISRKKVRHALVLHSNPDKFNGTYALQQNGVQVMTSAQVADLIPAVHRIRVEWFADDYKPDYPLKPANPNRFGDRTQDVEWAGLKIRLHVLGRGCSAAHVVAQVGDAVFVGDLINPDNHAWLELGLIDEWLQRLDEIRAMKPVRVFPGRGKPGGSELIEKQAAYLRYVQQLVWAERPSGLLDQKTQAKLSDVIEREYPTLGFRIFMRSALAAVWEKEAVKLIKGENK